MRDRRVAVVVVVVALALAACSGGGSKATSGATVSHSPAASSSDGPTIEITNFAPSGSNVEVDVQVTNTTSQEFRWTWAQFVLVAPDGSRHAPSRDPNNAGYDLVAPAGTFVNGAFFVFPRFSPGRYQVLYAGKVLATKTL